jgi:hypothetical protein
MGKGTEPVEIFVIVENISTIEDGQYSTEEVLCQKFGYFTKEQDAEERVDSLNKKYTDDLIEKMNVETVEELSDHDREDAETRFAYIPLAPAKVTTD